MMVVTGDGADVGLTGGAEKLRGSLYSKGRDVSTKGKV
jgi:hypothetical protein